LQHIRLKILNILLVLGSTLGSLAYFSNIFTIVRQQLWAPVILQTVIIALAIFMAINERIGYTIRANVLVGIIFVLAVSDLYNDGLGGEGRLFLVVYTVLAFVLFHFRQAIIAAATTLIAVIVIAVLMVQQVLPNADLTQFDSTSSANWITAIAVYALMTALAVFAVYSVIRGLEGGLGEQKHLAGELETERSLLEERVQLRTAELEKRAADMETSNNFGQLVSQLNGLDEILPASMACYQDNFHYANQILYLFDEKQQKMEAKAFAGEAGQALTREYPSISLGIPGTFASLTIKGEARLLRNQSDDAIYFRGPVSKMNFAVLLPLKTAGQLKGYIVLFSEEYREISMQDIVLYQNIASQIASGVERVRLLAVMERSVQELKASARQATQHSWRAYLKSTRRKTSYRYSREGLQAGATEQMPMPEALKVGKIVVTPLPPTEADNEGEPGGMMAVAVPIILREQTLGVINMRVVGSSVPSDMMHMVVALSRRLALSLENARLVDEVQQRAERESAVGLISSKVRASNDIDGILKTAAQEIGRSLGVAEVIVQLRNEH
jgi:GAF domain-containing protein